MHEQSGFALIEVVVSAGLLMVVAAGVLAGIDGPSAISQASAARTQASALAQKDQERMRAMPVSSLVGYSATTTDPTTNYTVASSAVWIRDNNDANSCNTAASDTSGDYLKITSRVTPPAPGRPVQIDSLLTPPPGTLSAASKGILALQLTDQANQPVVGQSASITGPTNMTVPTNSAGCAVFGLVTKGAYQISFSRLGWVDPAGVSNVVIPTSVTPGSTTLETHQYAQAGTIHVDVQTKVGAAAPVASTTKAVTVSNGGVPTGSLTFTNGTATASWNLAVFPFTTGYGVWSGGCATGDPTTYGQAAVTAAPAAGATANVIVRQPSIVPTGATGVPGYPGTYAMPSGATLVWTSIGTNCNEKFTQTTGSGGSVPQPGVPYGTYRLCGSFSGAYAQIDSFVNSVAGGWSGTLPYRNSGGCP